MDFSIIGVGEVIQFHSSMFDSLRFNIIRELFDCLNFDSISDFDLIFSLFMRFVF